VYGQTSCIELTKSQSEELAGITESPRFRLALQELKESKYDDCCFDQAHLSVYSSGQRVIVPWERIGDHSFGVVLRDLDQVLRRILGRRYRYAIDPRE
jgi:hypothetical protein